VEEVVKEVVEHAKEAGEKGTGTEVGGGRWRERKKGRWERREGEDKK
jgi:hypothetical protein